ncbi:MAG: leucine-rich repeat protein [Bacteroidaceae bacterium]|nr:leucine-rich repeat protein [Bacteroidaceae bacterium]
MLKYNIMRRMCWLLAAVACIAATSLRAQDEVFVEKAGTLSSLLTGSETKLKLTGSINGTDVKYLRQLTNEKSLTSLDLSEVKIVNGGVAYYESYKTAADVIGECMFTECKKLREVVLPTSVGTIGKNAFSRSGLRKVDIPNNVSRLGMDAFAYCSSLATVVIGSRVSQLDQGVFYSSPVKTAYVKPLTPPATPPYLFSSNPSIRVYSDALSDYKQSSWKEFGTITGRLESIYPMEADESTVVNALRETFFEDAACTTLKATYQAMGDDELAQALSEAGMPQFMTEIAQKLKNNEWAAYEQDFRIHSYRAYSDAAYWNDKMKSTGGSYMGNPTGIYVKNTEPLYVFVDADVPEDATLYIAGCTDNNLITTAKTGKKLTKGLNIVDGQKGALYYIVYTADTRTMKKALGQWPEMKIHIEGGTVNGYYDVARHSDKDYQAILKAATHERFTVRGGQALFNFKTTTYRKVWPSTIDKSICWYDSLTVWEKELMGFCESVATGQRAAAPFCLTGGEAIFPLYYNNPNFAIEGVEADAGWANSTPYRTSYNSVDCIRSSFDVSRSDHDDWCSAHECGHNNQSVINLEGGTEVSNNLFSNVIRYLTGRVTSVGSPLSTVMNEYAKHEPFFVRDVNSQLRMYYQLYLYYHQAQKNTSFYPDLFKELRRDPLGTRYSNTYQTSLKFVRKVCEVAQEDLTDFFTAWGFFEPCTNLSIEDYGAHTMTVRQADINRTLAEIAKYPRKNRTILFIEDRADYVLTRDFVTAGGKKRRDSEQVGQCGELGQFTSFMPDAESEPSSYTYLQADSLYAMSGTGGVGFLALDGEGRMRYASNSLCFCIPTSIGDDFTLYSIDADGTLQEAVRSGDGAEVVRLERAGTLKDTLSATAIKATIGGTINGTDIKYMRQLISEGNLCALDLSDAKVSSGGVAYYESYRSSTNAIGNHAFYGLKKLISICLPQSITKIEGNAFARTGIREVRIPDGVTSVGGDAFAYCDQLNTVVVGAKVRTMEQGVFYSSDVKHAYVKASTPPSIAAYLFSSKPVIHVYAKSLAAYKASAWADFGTLVGDLDDYEDMTYIEEMPQAIPAGSDPEQFFDLQGRRVSHLRPGSIYIRKGKKVIYK